MSGRRDPSAWLPGNPLDLLEDADGAPFPEVVQEAFAHRMREAIEGSVLQPWVHGLPRREQGTLMTAVRGCDDEPKQWTARGVAESPGRRLTAFIRWAFLQPADTREVDIPGAFFQSSPPPPPFKPSEFGHLPQHWYSHVMHALEVLGYRHPDPGTGEACRVLYRAMVHNLHLRPEPYEAMVERLSEDRIASGTVVS